MNNGTIERLQKFATIEATHLAALSSENSNLKELCTSYFSEANSVKIIWDTYVYLFKADQEKVMFFGDLLITLFRSADDDAFRSNIVPVLNCFKKPDGTLVADDLPPAIQTLMSKFGEK